MYQMMRACSRTPSSAANPPSSAANPKKALTTVVRGPLARVPRRGAPSARKSHRKVWSGAPLKRVMVWNLNVKAGGGSGLRGLGAPGARGPGVAGLWFACYPRPDMEEPKIGGERMQLQVAKGAVDEIQQEGSSQGPQHNSYDYITNTNKDYEL